MRRRMDRICWPLMMVLAVVAPALPQGAPSPVRPTALPVKVQIVLTRDGGNGKVVTPVTLFTSSSGEAASLRIGAEVPIPSGTLGQFPYTLQQFGTQVDCTVKAVDDPEVKLDADRRYKVTLTITKRDIYDEDLAALIPQKISSMSALYSFVFAGTVALRNGETAQISGADMLTNAMWQAEIALSVKK
jgi:hypothetical protein